MPVVVARGGASLSNGSIYRTTLAAADTLSAPTSRQSPQFPQVEPAPATTFAIVNNNNTQVSHIGSGVYTVEKISGTGATYDAGAVSSSGVAGDFVLRLAKQAGTFGYGGGISASPLTNDSYDTVDSLFLYGVEGNNWSIYETGVAAVTGLANNTYAWIWRTGTSLSYGRGATLAIAQASPDRTITNSSTVFFDSALRDAGDKLEATLFLPQDLVGSSSLTFAPSATATGTGALAGTSTLVFAPSATASGKGALSGTSTLVFAPSSTITGLAPITGTSSLTFTPSGTATGKGALSGTSTLTFAPSGTATGIGALSGTSALVFSPTGTATGKGALSGASTLTFAPAATPTGKGALSGASTLTFAPTATVTGKGALTGTSSLTFTPSGALTSAGSSGSLTGTASLSFASASTLTGAGALSGSAAIAFAPTGTLGGIGYITGISSLTFDVAGTLTSDEVVVTTVEVTPGTPLGWQAVNKTSNWGGGNAQSGGTGWQKAEKTDDWGGGSANDGGGGWTKASTPSRTW